MCRQVAEDEMKYKPRGKKLRAKPRKDYKKESWYYTLVYALNCLISEDMKKRN
jgi:hypothetical protein